MDKSELIFTLSTAGEQVVRSYACTQLKRWFAPPTIGYITITNKRLVFHSSGQSLTGRSLLINEMPLDDIAGVTVYEGLSFNWLLFLLFLVMASVATQVVTEWLPPFFSSYLMGVLLALPFLIIRVSSSNILDNTFRERALQSLEGLFQGKFKINRDTEVYLTYTGPQETSVIIS